MPVAANITVRRPGNGMKRWLVLGMLEGREGRVPNGIKASKGIGWTRGTREGRG